MTKTKFLQLHHVSPFAAVNLTLGDGNQPKRMHLGNRRWNVERERTQPGDGTKLPPSDD